MGDTYLRQSPLAHLHLDARAANEPNDGKAGVEMGERRFLGMINLRGETRDPAFSPRIKKILGVDLPQEVNNVKGKPDGIHILCLGPNEWLVVTPQGDENKFHTQLTQGLAELHVAISLTGEARTTIRLSGLYARDTLAKGCPLDLHPRAFEPGQCAQTLLARASMTLHQIYADNVTLSSTYDIIVLRSYAEYIWTWLEDAAQEFGLKVINRVK